MNREQIIGLFAERAPEMIAAWADGKGPLETPQHANQDVVIELAQAEHSRKKITSVLDFGCGFARWFRFWLDGIGVPRITGVEPTPELANEAERRFEADSEVEVILGDFIKLDERLGKRWWDLGFTFTALEHVPPDEIERVARILKERTKRLLLIEMIEESKTAKFCEYVFKHDYAALFGEPSFMRMIDENKAAMLWK